MPLYEYQCDNCGERFERIRKFSDPPLDEPCPKCGGPIRKLLSSPAIQFKGKGWYVTDYAKGSGGGRGEKKSEESKSSESSSDSKSSTESKTAKESPSTSKDSKASKAA